MVSPAMSFTAAYERILFTEASVAQALSRWKTCSSACARDEMQRNKSLLFLGIVALRHDYPQHAAFEATRAKIRGGAGKNCSESRTMDLFAVVIIAAMLFTAATVFLGVLTMSVGGSTDNTLSTPLMWVRVGCQAFTLLLLFAAMRLR